MIDILVYLFENYQDFAAHPAPDALALKLNALGFEENEISAALAWLDELKTAHAEDFTCDPRSLRVFSLRERQRISAESLDFLIFIEAAGVITPVMRELILDRCLALPDDPVSLGRFKIIVLMVLWSREQDLEPLIVEELLSASEGALAH
ncbi:DUF494 family protein [Rhodocyclus tenuis]|uniref:Protein Smg homolog n=2 Tax=Rhodocyclus TaxID=1064 RepID=A0A6L5JXM1_RHOTE|nr:DUF494 domain-containing protein [Rhodocyclus gracilis]MQY51781.1 DUF494 family protein [Rhodocyclus gracilis]MRD73530.1 DUF494 family protein [Rhodocyclus gracilis]NJA88360.1 DUF494 family protein [Rhodocyclus gracilis]